MSISKLTAGFTISAVVAYFVLAAVDTRYGISARIAGYLP